MHSLYVDSTSWILRAAATHYPLLRKFLHDVRTAIRSHVFVHNIDQAPCAGDFHGLMELTEMTDFETMLTKLSLLLHSLPMEQING